MISAPVIERMQPNLKLETAADSSTNPENFIRITQGYAPMAHLYAKFRKFTFSGVQYHTRAQTKVKCGVENLTFIGIISRQYACGTKDEKWNTEQIWCRRFSCGKSFGKGQISLRYPGRYTSQEASPGSGATGGTKLHEDFCRT